MDYVVTPYDQWRLVRTQELAALLQVAQLNRGYAMLEKVEARIRELTALLNIAYPPPSAVPQPAERSPET